MSESGVQGLLAALAEAKEFLKNYAGEKSSFYQQLLDINPLEPRIRLQPQIAAALQAFIEYIKNGLNQGLSIERKAQIEAVSDFLNQANTLLNNTKVHPAAPTVIIGAALEEFLRNWIEDEGLSIGTEKPGIDTYAKALKIEDLIDKQDIKDITSWAGLRNHAAHGEWEKVENRDRISNMMEGVNLFMRKYIQK